MRFIFHLSPNLWTAKMRPVIYLAVLTLACFSAKAQTGYGDDARTYGIAIKLGYDVPVGNLSYTFKPAVAYNFNVVSNNNNITINAGISYHVYKPKQDTFYYAIDEANYGTETYKNFTVLGLYIGGAYNVEITDGVKAYAGLDFGAYYTHLISQSNDEFSNSSYDLHQQNIYLAPKLGIAYSLNENVAIGLEGKYNLFAPTGQKVDNPAVGTYFNSYSGYLVLTYNF